MTSSGGNSEVEKRAHHLRNQPMYDDRISLQWQCACGLRSGRVEHTLESPFYGACGTSVASLATLAIWYTPSRTRLRQSMARIMPAARLARG